MTYNIFDLSYLINLTEKTYNISINNLSANDLKFIGGLLDCREDISEEKQIIESIKKKIIEFN